MDHLTALKVFRAVAANGGFAAAARQMNLSPAAVSKNVAELEAHLKVRLINRTTRSMSLTEAGEVYRQRLERILDDLEAADAALTSMQQGPSGLLRVSAPLTLALTCLTPAIPAFLQRYPDLRLELLLQDGRQDLIAEGIDLALRVATGLRTPAWSPARCWSWSTCSARRRPTSVSMASRCGRRPCANTSASASASLAMPTAGPSARTASA